MAFPTAGGMQLWADRRWRAGWRVQQHVLTGHHRLLDPSDRRHAWGDFAQCESAMLARDLPPAPRHVVVLLHGLARSRRSLAGIAKLLREAGHTPVMLDYPSTRRELSLHVQTVMDVLRHLEGAERVSFVTHSLGGIIARGLLSSAAWPSHLTPHRMVMLAPPNKGAAFARLLDESIPELFATIMGPSGQAIARGLDLPAPSIPFMVVAGSRRAGRGLNPAIEGDDDGVVGVEETRLPGMSDHVIVDALHTFVMDHPRAKEVTLAFLGNP